MKRSEDRPHARPRELPDRRWQNDETLGLLDDALRRWRAITTAANSICNGAALNRHGLETLRVLLVIADALANEAADLIDQLRNPTGDNG